MSSVCLSAKFWSFIGQWSFIGGDVARAVGSNAGSGAPPACAPRAGVPGWLDVAEASLADLDVVDAPKSPESQTNIENLEDKAVKPTAIK